MNSLVKTLCSKTVNSRFKVQGIASIFSIETDDKDRDDSTSLLLDTFLKHHLFLTPPFHQSHFVSTAHTERDINRLIDFLNQEYTRHTSKN